MLVGGNFHQLLLSNMEKQTIKSGIMHKSSYVRAAVVVYQGRDVPTFVINNESVVTVVLPKWWSLLIKNKKVKPSEVEHRYRILKEALTKINVVIVSYSFYEEEAYIIIKIASSGSPVDHRTYAKTTLRLFRIALKAFKTPFIERVGLLEHYKFDVKNNKAVFCRGPKLRPLIS